MTKFRGILLMVAFAISAPMAQATERLVLRYHDLHLPYSDTIQLKQEIRDQFPEVDVRNLELYSVTLIAKTRRGIGSASLEVGRRSTFEQRVRGNPRDFNRRDRRTYDRVTFDNPSRSSAGAWQLVLHGEFKVRGIIIEAEEVRRRPPRRPPRHPRRPRR